MKPSDFATFARRWRPFSLVFLLAALAALVLLAGDASAQVAQGHISVKSPSASATNTHGEVQQVTIKEGENLTFTFAIREARRAGTATFAYEFREERPTRDATAGADFEAASGTITVTGDTTADAQPQETLTVIIPWEWASGHTDSAEEGFSLRLHALNTSDNIRFQNENRNELVIPIEIQDRKPPITINADNGSPANGASGTEKWNLTPGLDPDVGKIAFKISIPEPKDAGTTPTVDYAITSGTANANDYGFEQGMGASGTISFRGTPGGLDGTSQTSRTYTLYVSPVNDNFVEQAETLTLTLSNPSDGMEFPDMNGDGTADTTLTVQGVIEADDTVGATVRNVTVTEGNVAAVSLSLTRSLVANESASISVGVRPAESCTTGSGAHAVAGLDYRVPAATTFVFGPGDSSKSFSVQTLEDITDEHTECLLVSYYQSEGIRVAAGADQITPTAKEPGAVWVKVKIEDDDDAPTLSFPNNTVGVVEPDEGGTATLTLEARLDVPSAKSVTVDYAHHFQGQSDEATSGDDFEAFQPGTLTFAPGETQKTLAITVKGDYVEEPDELVSVQFHSPENACFSTTGSCGGGGVTSYGIIRNNDSTVKLSFTVDDPTVREGDTAVVRLTLSRPIPYEVTAKLDTKDITATGGLGGDYGGRTGGTFGITIPAGGTTGTNTIHVNDDGVSGEGAETFTLKFADNLPLFFLGISPGNLTPLKQMFGANYEIADVIASVTMPVVTIVDGPALSVKGVKDTVTEGQPVQLRATLSEPAASDVTFQWKTQDGGIDTDSSRTAKADKDYTARAAQAATIPAGTTSIDLGTVQTLQDTVDEWSQQFSVVLESINGAQADDTTAVVTIRDDDTRPGLSVADATADEGDALSFSVSLSAASEKEVMAHWLTEDDTATGVGYARDYQPMEQRQSLTFAPGETTKTITVQTVEDRKAEPTERFKVQLLHAPNARFRDPTAIGTIRDDDKIEVSITAPEPVTEGPSRNAVFTVSIFPAQASDVTIQWETADELNTGFYTAEAGKDYTAQGKTNLTFAEGQTQKTVSVRILNDSDFEATETFRVLLSGDASKFLFLSATAHGAIEDDDSYDLYAQTAWPEYIVEGDPGPGEIQVYTLNLQHDQLSADDARGWTRFHALRCELDVPVPLSHSYVGYLPPPGSLESEVTSWAGGDVEVGTGSNTFGGLARCSQPRAETAYTTLSIPFDTRQEQMYLRVRRDDTPENNERFTVWIIPNTGPWRVLGPDIAKHGLAYSVIIIDDDRPQATITGATVDEDDTNAQVTVRLNQAGSQALSVFVETRDGTATAAQDYAHVREQVTFAAGETSKTVNIPLVADDRIEGDTETLFVFLDDASSGLNIDPRQEEAEVTINEASDIALTIPDRVVDEGDTMPVMFNLSDRLPKVAGWNIAFEVNTDFTGVSDPASAGDYDADEWATKPIRMAAGASGARGYFATTEDTEVEGDEDIGLVLNSFTSTRTLEYDGRRAGGSRYVHAPMVTIRDDDYNTVSISAYEDGAVRSGAEWTSGTPTESGNPDGHVTWTLEGNDGGEFTIDNDTGVVTLPAQSFESPADHNTDNVYEAIVRATDEDGNSDTQPVKVSIIGRELVISETSVTVAENGAASYTVKLDSQPVAGDDVTVALTTKGDTAAMTVDKTQLTFTSANWNDAQTITVTGVDDFILNAGDQRTATIVHKSTGSGFTVAVEDEVAVVITDNDEAGINLSVDTLTMPENGGTGSYDVTLTAQPTEAITIFVIPTGVQGPVVVAPRVLTFQPADWNKPQTVTVTGMDDNKVNPGGERRFRIIHWGNIGPDWSSVAGEPGQVEYAVNVTLTDNDLRGVIVSKRIINVDATVAAGDTYTVKLKSQPNGGSVTVTPGSTDKGTKINISPASLTFDNSNWETPKTVTVTAIDDPDAASHVSTITHAVSGADYGDVTAPDVTAHVQFSRTGDTGGLRITVGEAATEGGDGVTFTVTRPDSSTDEFWWYIKSYSGDVPSADADDFESSDALDFNPSRGGKNNARKLLFRSGNSQSFTVTPVDDTVDEETEYFIVLIKPVDSTTRKDSTASDWRDAIGIIHDNDDPPTLSVADVTVAEEGKEAVFTATMSHASSRDVAFKWKTADDTATDANPATAGTDYTAVSTAQTVTIAAGETTADLKVSITDDTDVEEVDETFLVVLSEPTNAVLSAMASTATGTITDNDVPGEFTLTVEGGNVKENQRFMEPASITGNPVGDITWTLSGDDAALFTVTPMQDNSKRAMLSLPAQDHENPTDKNKDRVYKVTVSATDEDDTVVSKNISVTVLNVTDFNFTIEALGSVYEGDPVSLKITLQGRPTSDTNAGATLNWIIEPDGDGAHPAGASDYGTPTSGTITWAHGATGDALTQTITIPTTEDTLDEHNETFIIRLKDAKAIASDDTVISEEPFFNLPSRVANMTRDGVQVVVVVTIIDDFDASAVVSVGNPAAAVTEGDDPFATVDLSFPVSLSMESGRDVTVTYSVGGTATSPGDYFSPGRKSLTIRAGTTTGAIIIPVHGDVLDEADETVTVTLETATNATLDRTQANLTGSGTITDDDAAKLSIGDAEADEGEKATFTITLSPLADRDVTVKWKTAADSTGDHPATSGTDFTAVSTAQTVTIAAGASSATVEVQTTEDNVDEEDETFLVQLSAPTIAALDASASTGTGTINDDEGDFYVNAPNNQSVDENQEYNANPAFSVGGNPVGEITWTKSGDDAALFTITPETNNSKIAELMMPAQDYENPADEDKNNVYEITMIATDDAGDEERVTLAISVMDVSEFGLDMNKLDPVDEGDPVSLSITLSSPPANTVVTLAWAIEPDEAGDHPAGTSDYGTPTSGTATWPAAASGDDLTQTITIPTTQDTLDEHDETFILRLTDAKATASNSTVVSTEPGFTVNGWAISPALIQFSGADNVTVIDGGVRILGTITDDDSATAVVSVGAATAVTEGDLPATTVDMSFPVSLNAASGKAVTVTYSVGGTATAPADYIDPETKSATIEAGETTGAIVIKVKGDVVDELNETITVTLTGATNAALHSTEANLTGSGTINDDDAAKLSIGDATADEGDKAAFTITLSPVSDRPVTVKWKTAADGDGDHPAETTDFTAVSTAQTVTIAAGASSVKVEVQTTEDAIDEEDETFLVTLSAPTNAALDSTASTGTGTITDDDSATAVVSVGAATAVTEGDLPATTVDMSFPVSLNAASGKAVTVTYSVGGTATAPADYIDPETKSATIEAGETTGAIVIKVKGDVVDELNETITVTLTGATNAALHSTEANLTGSGTINDDDAAKLSIGDATADEGDKAAFTITLSPVSDRPVTVKWKTAADGDGDHPAETTDFTAVSTAQTVTIAAGASSVKVEVQTTEDAIDEEDETFLVTLSAPTNAALDSTASTGTGTITDDDSATAVVSVGAATAVTEGDLPATTVDMSFPVSLNAASGKAVTVTYSVGGTATAPADYIDPETKSATIEAGETTGAIVIKVKGDVVDELNETITVTLTGATNAALHSTEANLTGSGTINDDDAAKLSIGDATADEGDKAAFTITLSPVSDRPVTVKWKTAADGDGDHPAETTDFTAVSTAQTVTIAAGASSVKVEVQTTEDAIDEEDETFLVTLSAPTNAALDSTASTGTGTITDDDSATAVVSVGAATAVTEGDLPATTVDMSFPVSLNAASGKAVTVTYSVGGTATAPADYIDPETKSATIEAGETTGAIVIKVKGDVVDELNETITVTLTGATNAALHSTEANLTGSGTINDDDAAKLSIGDATADEGDKAAFTITLSPVSDRPVTVKWKTAADGDGDHPAETTDFTAVSTAQTVTIAAGASSVKVEVQTTEDAIDEEDETFLVTLSAPTNAALDSTASTGTGTITDDDSATAVVSVGAATAVTEGDLPATTVDMSFPVSLNAASGKAVTVTYSVGGTATAPADYIDPETKSATIEAGETTGAIVIKVKGDVVDELNETITVTLTGATNAALHSTEANLTGSGTINDDDAAKLSIGDATADEGDKAAFTITLSPVSDRPVTVKWKTAADGDGDHPAETTDFTAVSTAQTVTIAAGASSVKVEVQTTEDAIDEEDETFLVTLSAPTNAALDSTASTGTGTITDDDSATAVVSVGAATAVTEGDLPATTVDMSFPVSLNAASGKAVTVTYSVGGTATAPADYIDPETKSATIEAGETTGAIVIKVKGDVVDELNETITVTLTGATNAALHSTEANLTGSGTINDDDATPTTISLSVSPTSVDENVQTAPTMTVTATLGGASVLPTATTVTVAVGKQGDTAVSGTDYTAVTAFTITIPAEQRSGQGTFTLTPTDDTLNEEDESLSITGTAQGFTVSDATVSITDDDGATSTLTIDDTLVAEGHKAVFTIGLKPVSSQTVTVQWVTATDTAGDHPAIAGVDYTAVTTAQTATIAAGESSATVEVQTTKDSNKEEQETFLVVLSNPVNADLPTGSIATGYITDVADRINRRVIKPLPDTPTSVNEGVITAPTVRFTISLAETTYSTAQTITVSVGKAGDSAVSGVDYTAVSNFDVTLPAEASSVQGSFTLDPIDDALDEDVETLTISASLAGMEITDLLFTITDNDPEPSVSIADAQAVTEGDDPSTTTDMSFPVTLSVVSGRDVTVPYTLGGTSASGIDYTVPSPLRLTIPAGEKTRNIVIPIKGDLVDEEDETVIVTLVTPANATLGSPKTAEGTIKDNDPEPSVSIIDATVAEGTTAWFTIEMDRVSDRPVTVQWVTVNDTSGTHPATADVDYTAVTTAQTATIPAGASSVLVGVHTTEDTLDEQNETFKVTLSAPTNATLDATASTATGTIVDNDGAGEMVIPTVSLRFEDPSPITEGEDLTVLVTGRPAPTVDTIVTFYVGDTDKRELEDIHIAPEPDAWFKEDRGLGLQQVTIRAGTTEDAHTIKTKADAVNREGKIFATLLSPGIERTDGVRNLGWPDGNLDPYIRPDPLLYQNGNPGRITAKILDGPDTAGPLVSVKSVDLSTIPSGTAAAFMIYALPVAESDVHVHVRFTAEDSDILPRGVAGERIVTIPAGMDRTRVEIPTLPNRASQDTKVTLKILRGIYTRNLSFHHDDVVVRDNAAILPTVDITLARGGTEGRDLIFTLTTTPAGSLDHVEVDVKVDGDYGVNSGRRTVHIPASGSTTLVLSTTDDAVDEVDGSVTMMVRPSYRYRIGPGWVGNVAILDNDEPGAGPDKESTNDNEPPLEKYADLIERIKTDMQDPNYRNEAYDLRRVLKTLGVPEYAASPGPAVSVQEATNRRTLPADNPHWEGIAEAIQYKLDYDAGMVNPPTPPEITISGGSGITEGGTASFTISADPVPANAITVNVRVSETGDWDATGAATVSVNSATTTYTIATSDDQVDEADGSVKAAVKAGDGYTVGTPSAATVAVSDDDVPEITISGGSGITEGGSASFTISASPVPASAITINVGVTETGDWDATGAATVSVNSATTTYTISTTNDEADEADGSVTATVQTGADYTVGTPAAASVTVADDDDPAPEPPLEKYASLVKSFYDRITANGQHGDDASGGWNKRFLKAMGHPEYVNYPQAAVTVAQATDLYNHGGPGANTAWEGTAEAIQYKLDYDAGTVNPPPTTPEITISGGSGITEGGTASFTISASPAPASPITVNIGVSQSGSWGATGAATVSVNSATTTYTITTSDDQVDEADGSVTATVQSGTGYTVGTASSASVAVADDDVPPPATPEITISGGSGITEGGTASFTISASPVPASAITVNIGVSETGDWDATGAATVSVNSATTTYTIATSDDQVDEANGSVTATVQSGTGYTVGTTSSASVAVADDDVPPPATPEITISGGSGITEGGTASFTISASPAPASAITVNVGVTETGDWGATGAATVSVSGATATYTIATSDDNVDEDDGSVTATVQSGSGYTVGNVSSASVTVADDDVPPPATPEITISGGSGITEGGTASFTISASPAPANAITVNIGVSETGDWDATGAATVSVSGATATYTIATSDDNVDEDDGSVTATVQSGSGYTVGTASTATVTVADDDYDTAPLVLAEDPLVKYATLIQSFYDRITDRATHGDDASGGWNKRFLKAMGHPEYVNYPQAAVTVAQATDLYNHGGPGANTAWEGTAEAIQYKLDYDAGTVNPPPDPVITISGGSGITEGGTASFTISASPAPASAITVNIGVSQSGSWGATGAATVSVNSATTTYTITTSDDQVDEADGSVTATVQSGTGYTVGTASSASVAVADDDVPPPATPEITISGGSGITEGGTASFTISASPVPASAITVNIGVSETGDWDATGAATVSVNSATTTYTITTSDDQVDETDGSVTATVQAGSGYTVGTASSASVSVADDDVPPPTAQVTISIEDASAPESASDLVFRVTLSEASDEDITVNWRTLTSNDPDRRARAGQDYWDMSGEIRISAGETSGTGAVWLYQDSQDEPDEVFTVYLYSPAGATIAREEATMTIIDDD